MSTAPRGASRPRCWPRSARLHPLPERPYTAVFGVTRTVGANMPVISFEGGEYSVRHQFRSEVVWVRRHAGEVIVTAVEAGGAGEVARHERPPRATPATSTSTLAPPQKARSSARHGPAPTRRPPSWRSATARACG